MTIVSIIFGLLCLSGYVSLNHHEWCSLWHKESTEYRCSRSNDVPVTVGSGIAIAQKYNISDINTVEINGIISLTVRQADTESLVIETDDNVMDFVEISTANSTLKIGIKDNTDVHLKLKKHIACLLKVKNIKKIKQYGATMLDIAMNNENLSIEACGSTRISGVINTEKLTIYAPGSLNINLAGVATSQWLTASGSGNYNFKKLKSENASLSVSGSSKIQINATKNITGSMPGSSTLWYIGNPNITVANSASSEIKKLYWYW